MVAREQMSNNAIQRDAFLDDSRDLLGALFERVPMGIAVLDRNFIVRLCNPTWAAFVKRYTRSAPDQVKPGTPLFELAPGIERAVLPGFEQVLSGQVVQQVALRLDVDDIISFWDATLVPLKHNGEVTAFVLMTTDATDRVLAQQTLEKRVADRTRAAVVAERNRIARDLHDSVTQTLFSASVIAESLPRLVQRNPDMLVAHLEQLRQLTRGALAEMRMLLLELRPAVLTQMSLKDLLKHLVEATAGRGRVAIDLTVDERGKLPSDVQVALYRIAQEALNNVARHSAATRAAVNVRHFEDRVELCISDDGKGFDACHIGPEHLGLKIMHERAEEIGATLSIESRVGGCGTSVEVTWSTGQDSPKSQVPSCSEATWDLGLGTWDLGLRKEQEEMI